MMAPVAPGNSSAPAAGLRAATEADIDAVAGIWQRGWREVHLGHVPDELVRRRRPEDMRALVADRVGTTTVATIGADVVGFVIVHDDEIEHIYVDDATRGTGVASALLAHGEAVVGGRFDRAWLAVVEGNARARRFYERHGWSDAGPFDNPATTADGATVLVPCRRYEKPVAPAPD